MPDHPVAWKRGLPDNRLRQAIELQVCADYRMKKLIFCHPPALKAPLLQNPLGLNALKENCKCAEKCIRRQKFLFSEQ